MKRNRNFHAGYVDEYADSIQADLREAYERGRRDQREFEHPTKRSSPLMLLLIGGLFIAGAWMFLATLNDRSRSTPGASPALAAAPEFDRTDGKGAATDSGWITVER